MDATVKHSQLKQLLRKGKAEGFLTYAELNERLPAERYDADQIEAVVDLFNEAGIEILEQAPDPDSLLLPAESSTEEVAEEVEAILETAVADELGRVSDALELYMRAVGTLDLLTRDEEIVLAKRFEEGARERTEALCIESGELRSSDLVVGFLDANGADESAPVSTQTGQDGEVETPTLTAVDTGPDPRQVKARFARIRRLYARLKRVRNRYGIGSAQASKSEQRFTSAFLEVKFVPKQIDRWSGQLRELAGQVRTRERVIMDICVNQAGVPRKRFLETFRGNETSRPVARAPDGRWRG